MKSMLLMLIGLATFARADIACPFDPNECNCTNGQSATAFDYARCVTGNYQFPIFVGTDGQYSIDEELNLKFTASNIPTSSGLRVFNQINLLNLTQPTGPTPSPANWAYEAFTGPQITRFAVNNVAGVVPPPPALVKIAPNLKDLYIVNCQETVSLINNSLSQFNNLNIFLLQDTPIKTIDMGAFNGVEKLGELWLINAKLDTFPTQQLAKLTNLYRIDMTGSNIQHFTSIDFAPFVQLLYLNLQGNNIQAAVDSGALLNLPNTTNNLWLASGVPPLTSVPTKVIQNAKQVYTISLAGNSFKKLSNGDFPSGTNLQALDLSANPIESIESGALQPLTNLGNLVLSNTAFTSFDFSILNGLDGLGVLHLDKATALKSLNISNVDQFPAHLNSIDASGTSLQYIDSKFASILSRPKFNHLDLTDVSTIVCTPDIQWMAKFVLCTPTHITAPNTRCSTGSSLSDYLATITPGDPCSATSPSTLPTAAGTSTGTAPPTSAVTAAPSSPDAGTTTTTAGSNVNTTAAEVNTTAAAVTSTTTKGGQSITNNVVLTLATLGLVLASFLVDSI